MSNKLISLNSITKFWSNTKTYIQNYVSSFVNNKLSNFIQKNDIINSFTSMDATKVAAAPTVKTLNDNLNQLNTKTTLKIVDKSIAFNGGSFNLHLSRDGSIVTASTSGVINIPEANTIYTFGQVIPEGFRPLVSCATAVALVSGQIQSGIMRLMVDENGTMNGVSSVNQNREIYGSISWDTGDPYPS